MAASDILIRGAREHNLRDVSLVLPRGQLICLTGVSGSGKSSLAFDTLYAEGQRRRNADETTSRKPATPSPRNSGGPFVRVPSGLEHPSRRPWEWCPARPWRV